VPTASQSALLRKLPSVDELLRLPEVSALAAREGRAPVTDAARAVLAQLRAQIGSGSSPARQNEKQRTRLVSHARASTAARRRTSSCSSHVSLVSAKNCSRLASPSPSSRHLSSGAAMARIRSPRA
jgi:hypothetical protein